MAKSTSSQYVQILLTAIQLVICAQNSDRMLQVGDFNLSMGRED